MMNTDHARLVYRPCRSFEELDECVELQVLVWGYDERDIIPRRLFTVAQRIGGQVFGAFQSTQPVPGRSLVGFAMALPAWQKGEIYLHSHMLAVHPDWRNAGVGRALKLVQRKEALSRGIRKMEWTFDPLEIKNAYLNIARLGAVVRSYTPDFYGPVTSSLQAGLPTDRMHAEWFLDSERVRRLLEGDEPSAMGSTEQRGQAIVVPSEVAVWKAAPGERSRAAAVQDKNRKLFLQAFAEGLAVVGFTRDAQGNGLYHLGEMPVVESTGP